MTKTVPFLYGVGTAGHQVEGGNTNSDWWKFEMSDAHPAEPSGDAIDHYHRYASDIELIRSLGFNCYRFSIEWARIEPAEGFFSSAALRHYRAMLACCIENRLVPMITLHHYASPQWVSEIGGWDSPRVPALFARFVRKVCEHLGDLMVYACTFNEMNVPALIRLDGRISDFDALLAKAPFPFFRAETCNPVVLDAHARAREVLRECAPHVKLGMTLHMHSFAAEGVPGGVVERIRDEVEGHFLRACRGDDFVGVQVYGRKYLDSNGVVPWVNEAGEKRPRDNSPEAISDAVRYAAEVSRCRVIVTENGYTEKDPEKKQVLIDRALSLAEMLQRDGLLDGYLYWSAFDIYEWLRGFEDAYGLISVDRATQRRMVSPLAVWLGEQRRRFEKRS